MDMRSMSYTSPANRATSRIYLDLAKCRLHSSAYNNEKLDDLIMDSQKKYRIYNTSKPPRICVVGAGLAGLRCADVLSKHGFDVTIIEARDRIGGRLHQTRLSTGHLVDLGPNWIHGEDHNPFMSLAEETGTALHSWKDKVHDEDKVNVFGKDGNFLFDGKRLQDIFWEVIKQAFKHSSQNTATIDPDESLHDFISQSIKQPFHVDDSEHLLTGRERNIVMQMSELWGAFVGSPVFQQSMKFFWLEECIDGDNLFVAGTYQKILERIARPGLEVADLKLSTEAVRFVASDEEVVIHIKGGQQLVFDEAVVTTPLGWLKRNTEAFEPRLPLRLRQAIDNIGYGCLEKVYITFPRAFWLSGATNPADESFTGFVQWLSPDYAPGSNPKRWNQEIVDLSTLPGHNAHPTILFYMYGDQSQVITSALACLSLQKERDDYLAKFFKPYYSRMLNFNEESEDCKPRSFYATNWMRDEYAGYGSYSTFRTGLKEGDKDIEVMREGLPGRGLWFAGEHTAPFVALGTTTGAYWSGEAVGKRIASAYGIPVKDDLLQKDIQDIVSTDGTKEVNVRGFTDKALEK